MSGSVLGTTCGQSKPQDSALCTDPSIAIRDKSLGDRGQGEGGCAAMLRSILTDASDAEIARILARYPVPVIRRALHRVLRAKHIRKSRAAFLRFLLGRFTRDIHAGDR